MVRASYDIVSIYPYRRREKRVELLLMQRAADSYLPLLWNVVSGSIEAGETATVAAVRELKEETNLVPRAVYQMNNVNSYYMADQDTIFHTPVFVARIDPSDQVILNDEHEDFAWITPDEMIARLVWPNQRRLIPWIVSDIIEAEAKAEAWLEYLRVDESNWR